ncbi:MAG: hypothetical protein WCC97_11925 [Candidatus Acidiferrales bacterium]
MSVLLPLWESIPTLRRCYVRLLSPEGDVHDVWQNNLEATLEGLDTPHEIFRSQKQWELFLNSQRAIATDWDLRNSFTADDRRFLDALRILWEPETFRHFRWRMSHVHDDDFLRDSASSFQELHPEQQEQLRKEICERTTGKPFRPD